MFISACLCIDRISKRDQFAISFNEMIFYSIECSNLTARMQINLKIIVTKPAIALLINEVVDPHHAVNTIWICIAGYQRYTLRWVQRLNHDHVFFILKVNRHSNRSRSKTVWKEKPKRNSKSR